MQQNPSVEVSAQAQKASVLKKDLFIAAIIGFFLALLVLPIIKQSEYKIPYVLSLLVILPILSAMGMFLAILIAQKIKFVYQAAKFILVGGLNTLIDWGVLNLLLFFINVSSGPLYSVSKGVSFAVAVVNSYFWNKHWTFKKSAQLARPGEEQKSARQEVLQFFLVSIIGFAINVLVASLVVNVWGPHFGISAKLWATVGAACGTVIGLAWNFLGYKLFVFKR